MKEWQKNMGISFASKFLFGVPLFFVLDLERPRHFLIAKMPTLASDTKFAVFDLIVAAL